MRYKLYISLLVSLAISVAANLPKNSSFEKDFQVFCSVLHEKEGTIDLHTDKDSIEYYLKDLHQSLSNDESLQDQFKLYSQTLSRLKCGHTQIYPNKKLLREWLSERKSMPIDYYLYDGRLIINKLAQADYDEIYSNSHNRKVIKSIPEHAELYRINGLTLNEMMLYVGRFISSDEDLLAFKTHQAGQLFEFYRHLAFPTEEDSVDITYVYGTDTVHAQLVLGEAPVHTMNNRIYKMSNDENVRGGQYGEFKIIRNEYAYFRFRSFNACGGQKYVEYLKNSFRKIEKEKIDKLVIDLRGNTGGVMQYDLMSFFIGGGIELGKYIIEKPSFDTRNKYIKKAAIDYVRHKKMSRKQRRETRSGKFNDGIILSKDIESSLMFKGEVIVITDESTFSSAAMLACHLKTLANAKIIGRPAGGSFYKGNSGTLQVKLPETGFNLLVNPNTFYSQLDASEDPGAIKQPDVYLNPGYMDSRKLQAYYFGEATKLFSHN